MPRRKRKKKRSERRFQDFRVVLELPERLAKYLRQILHLNKPEWDFCLDKIRQYKDWQEKRKTNPKLKALPIERRLYREWSKSKGRGKGRRYFAAPCEELKRVQKRILNHLLNPIRVHFCRHGNQRGCSILTNAGHHANFAKSVFSIDIINAFPTVFRSRIFANLKKPFGHALREFKGVEFSADDIVAMLNAICDLVCLYDRLPQGPPTSPRLLDIVCRKMDTELYGLLEENSSEFQSYRQTAWADDITVSSDGPIPAELRREVLEVIKRNGFIPHTRADKTKYFAPETGEKPVVTGLVINDGDRITMAPHKVDQFRSRLHQLLRLSEWDSEAAGVVSGSIGYIRQVYPIKLPSRIRALVLRCEERLAASKRAAALANDAAPAKAEAPTRRKRASKKKSDPAAKKKAGQRPPSQHPRAKDATHSSGNGYVSEAALGITSVNGNEQASLPLSAAPDK